MLVYRLIYMVCLSCLRSRQFHSLFERSLWLTLAETCSNVFVILCMELILFSVSEWIYLVVSADRGYGFKRTALFTFIFNLFIWFSRGDFQNNLKKKNPLKWLILYNIKDTWIWLEICINDAVLRMIFCSNMHEQDSSGAMLLFHSLCSEIVSSSEWLQSILCLWLELGCLLLSILITCTSYIHK